MRLTSTSSKGPSGRIVPHGVVLDIGTGTGRDADALAELGHKIVAVEPASELLDAAERMHRSHSIEWISDSLPKLESLYRIHELLLPKGVFALALRHGPPGVGCHYFPTVVEKTLITAAAIAFSVLRKLENQPSVIPGKDDVTWTRLVFMKGTVEDGSKGALNSQMQRTKQHGADLGRYVSGSTESKPR